MLIIWAVEKDPLKPSSGQKIHHPVPLRELLKNSPEGHVLMIGIALLFFYLLWLIIQLFSNPGLFHVLLGMTATEVVFGRVACMAFGYSMNMSQGSVVVISILLETILVLMFYPLFVFIWQQLLMIRWLIRISERTRTSAERHKDKVQKFGIIGLFVFVWFPFWMTGPVVGCMIGYLLGMRIWVTLATVLAGTYIAILGWAYLLRQTFSYNAYAVVSIAVIVVASILAWAMRSHLHRKEDHQA